MDKAQLILLRLPIFLFCSDLFNLFTPPPPKPQPHRPHQPPHLPHRQRPAVITLDFPSQYLRLFLLAITFAQVLSNNDITVETSDGDIVACIDKQKQPAFDHPLLKYHIIQESPSEIPRSIGMNKQNKWRTIEAHVSIAKCPDGMIPIQNITALYRRGKPETGNNSSFYPRHEYAEVTTQELQKLYGAKCIINVWEPVVENRETELSISQIWITTGDYDKKDLNTIEVGWQVCPLLYKDNKPRLFVFWTSDAYHTTGGYNLREPGFIQTSSEIVLGGAISPISSFGGSQFEITVLVWKDRKSGNWWLCLGPDNSPVGYWPREIFTGLAEHATGIDWGGEIVDSHSLGRHTKTQMGSGRFSEEGFGYASYLRNLEVLDDTNILQRIQMLDTHEEGTYYNTKTLHTDEWGTHIFYGGPGFGYTTHSGVFRLRLSLFFMYFIFTFFIIF